MYLPEVELYTDVINYLVSIKIGEDYNTPSGHYQSFCEVGTSTLHQQKDGRPNDMIRKSFFSPQNLSLYIRHFIQNTCVINLSNNNLRSKY